MKKILLALCLFAGIAHADTLFGGQPRMALEYEYEKNTPAYDSTPNTAISVFPGIQWKGDARPLGFITRAELMLEGNQDHAAIGTQASNSTGKTTEVKTGIRIRTDGEFNSTWGYYVRVLVGQSLNSERNFTYYYVEPALKTKFNDTYSWTTSYRAVRTFNRDANDADRNKLRFGPNIALGKNDELELRYVLATDPNSDNKLRSRAGVVEYVHKF